ncbi:CrcB-like protein [Syntrophobotulus glycolicus DSM 8271]|uniref:Fluoride-specific ion channel FluC n=1 Tax=Syntrophobotulus glycolicus (strain DSM 8271 / FlGlyR) TaxID=645991 RepID=F0T2T5_SYNGF|nr:fluoride efflux transporter CrcB [Syntrophobotulus glycolicus]ADY57572.1 CrcB-like protein [Syntrophobotulus glycolicus DSM 8271]
MYNFFAIALGGSLGALTRFQLGIWITQKWNHAFPLHTFIINLTGSFFLGFLNLYFMEKTNLDPIWRLAVCTGFLGAYTTFSTFSYETFNLFESGQYSTALFYILGSVFLSIIGVMLGIHLARLL